MSPRRPSKAEKAVFLEYHDTDDQARAYATNKLLSGTAALTPEAVLFMRGAIAERKAAKARTAALDKQLRETPDAAA